MLAPGEDIEESHANCSNRRVGRNYFRLLGCTVGFSTAMLVLGWLLHRTSGTC